MPIVSSIIVEDRVQVDGRRSVRERHTDDAVPAGVHEVSYLAEAEQDVNAVMAARVASIEAQLVEADTLEKLVANFAPI